MAKYYFSNKAVEDLTGIYEYTYKFWSENQADKYYGELIDYCQLIADNQNIGKNYTEIHPDFYGFIANKHIIFYRILNPTEVEIIRILGAEMDLKRRIKE